MLLFPPVFVHLSLCSTSQLSEGHFGFNHLTASSSSFVCFLLLLFLPLPSQPHSISALYSMLRKPPISSSPSSSPLFSTPPQLLSLKTEQRQPGRTASMFPCSYSSSAAAAALLKLFISLSVAPFFSSILNSLPHTLCFSFSYFLISFVF